MSNSAPYPPPPSCPECDGPFHEPGSVVRWHRSDCSRRIVSDVAVITVPVQVLKRFLRFATLEENHAVTKLLRMKGVIHPTQNDVTP